MKATFAGRASCSTGRYAGPFRLLVEVVDTEAEVEALEGIGGRERFVRTPSTVYPNRYGSIKRIAVRQHALTK
jgi:hypothetical protein